MLTIIMWVAMQVVVFGYKKDSKYKMYLLSLVGILGLEPRMTGPESVVLPLHHIRMLFLSGNRLLLDCECKGTTFF